MAKRQRGVAKVLFTGALHPSHLVATVFIGADWRQQPVDALDLFSEPRSRFLHFQSLDLEVVRPSGPPGYEMVDGAFH